MKTKIKAFFFSFFLIIFSGMLVYASWGIQLISETSQDFNTPNENDTVKIDTNTGSLLMLMTQNPSSDYTAWQRMYLSWAWIMITSEQYWIFNHSGWLALYQSWWVAWVCAWSGETVSYYFSGTTLLTSPYWGNVNIVPEWSYYCPASQRFSFTLSGTTIWQVTITKTTSSTTEMFVFDDTNIMIAWAVNTPTQISTTTPTVEIAAQSEASTSSYTSIATDDSEAASQAFDNNFVQVQSSFEGTLLELNTTIDRNIISMTKGKTWSWNTTLNPNFNNSFYFYDYRNIPQASTPSHENNRWNILILGSVAIPSDASAKMRVTWENTLIVLWWNLYITNDIYNNDKDSILTIVVRRDENNRRNGWNIYIHPNVTNIDAVLVADGSILNYNWTNIVHKDTSPNILKRQLYIYWAVNTKNTISPTTHAWFGTDSYEITSTNNLWQRYALGNLRTFQPMWNNPVNTWPCSYDNITGKVTAMWTTNTQALDYAFAGKKTCFMEEFVWITWLRTTPKLSPVVIWYNPLLQTKPPRILENTY